MFITCLDTTLRLYCIYSTKSYCIYSTKSYCTITNTMPIAALDLFNKIQVFWDLWVIIFYCTITTFFIVLKILLFYHENNKNNYFRFVPWNTRVLRFVGCMCIFVIDGFYWRYKFRLVLNQSEKCKYNAETVLYLPWPVNSS